MTSIRALQLVPFLLLTLTIRGRGSDPCEFPGRATVVRFPNPHYFQVSWRIWLGEMSLPWCVKRINRRDKACNASIINDIFGIYFQFLALSIMVRALKFAIFAAALYASMAACKALIVWINIRCNATFPFQGLKQIPILGLQLDVCCGLSLNGFQLFTEWQIINQCVKQPDLRHQLIINIFPFMTQALNQIFRSMFVACCSFPLLIIQTIIQSNGYIT